MSSVAPSSKKAKNKSFFDVLMGNQVLNLQYLQYELDVNKPQETDEQPKEKNTPFMRRLGLGILSPCKKTSCRRMLHIFKNAMCFIQKNWRVLLRADFPKIPDNGEDHVPSKLLSALAETTRNKRNM